MKTLMKWLVKRYRKYTLFSFLIVVFSCITALGDNNLTVVIISSSIMMGTWLLHIKVYHLYMKNTRSNQ